MDLYTLRRVAGHERLDDLTGPVVFVANHNSHMDTPVILCAAGPVAAAHRGGGRG